MDPHDDPRDPRDPRDPQDPQDPQDPRDSDLTGDQGDPAQDERQATIRDLLAGQPDPGPMPTAVERRISGALVRAGEVRTSDRELFDELGLVEEPVDDDGDLIRFPGAAPEASGAHDPGTHTQPSNDTDDSDLRGLLGRRWPVLAAAAAAVALLAFAGLTLFGGTRSGNDGLASLPGPSGAASSAGSVATSVAGRLHVQASGTAYTADTLASGARTLLTSPSPEVAADQAAALGALVTPDGANGCVAALGNADAPSVTIDLATYAGQPAAIVVISRSDKTSAYAVQRGCATGDPEVIKDAVPVP